MRKPEHKRRENKGANIRGNSTSEFMISYIDQQTNYTFGRLSLWGLDGLTAVYPVIFHLIIWNKKGRKELYNRGK